MVGKVWDLGWELYPSKKQIKINPDTTSIFCFSSSEDDIANWLSKLQKWFVKKGFKVCPRWTEEELSEDYFTQYYTAKKGSDEVIFGDSYDEAIIIVLSNEKIKNGLYDLVYDIKQPGIDFAVSVDHRIDSFKLDDGEGNGRVTTGLVDKSDEEMPELYRFYEYRIGRLLIAKALVRFVNIEMAEICPTIEMFEVKKAYRGRGLGRKFLERIEMDVAFEMFVKIWSTDDRTNMEFWMHMGYEMDLDEGYKWLLPPDLMIE